MNKLLFIILLVAASSAEAAVHKCIAPDGKVTYTDKGCPQDQDASGRDRKTDAASPKDAANPGSTGGGGGFYREQVKSAEHAAPKSEQPGSARP